MALSNEYYEYHLTPKGWIIGSVKYDHKFEAVKIPADRVLTCRYCDKIPCMGAKGYKYKSIVFEEKVSKRVRDLIRLYGKDPEGFEDWENKPLY